MSSPMPSPTRHGGLAADSHTLSSDHEFGVLPYYATLVLRMVLVGWEDEALMVVLMQPRRPNQANRVAQYV